MDRLDIVNLIEERVAEELPDHPNIQRELQQVLNYLKLLFLEEINLAEDLDWPKWTVDKGGEEKEWFRKALFQAYNSQCFWTGEFLDYNDMEIDHVIPKEKGGPNNFLNYVPCNMKRNRKKNDSLQTNLKLVATLYYVEAVYGAKLERQIRQIRQIREKAKRAKEKKETLPYMEKKERPELFSIFWYDYEKKVKESLVNDAKDKVQAFFQVHGKILNRSGIRKQLWERFNLEIANCSRGKWKTIVRRHGFVSDDGDYRHAIVDALQKIGIRGGRERLSFYEVKQMGVFSMKQYIALTHFNKLAQKKIYTYPQGSYKGVNKELARVMNRLAGHLEMAYSA